ncbi:MAG TPA: aldehyde dehydrogenase family protein, partial [Sphingopyxis sp.]|nr:aldehyde dehydrogenase family protein [Sphingopyxis sp.]
MDFDRDYAMLIGGKLEGGSARFDVLNPATEQVIGSVPDATQADLDRAIAAARAAFPGWAATPIAERKAALTAMGQAIMANADAFKRLLTAEQGKPHAEAEGEVMGAGYWLMGAA